MKMDHAMDVAAGIKKKGWRLRSHFYSEQTK